MRFPTAVARVTEVLDREGTGIVRVAHGDARWTVEIEPEGWQLLRQRLGQGELKDAAVDLHVMFWANHLLSGGALVVEHGRTRAMTAGEVKEWFESE